MNWLVRKFDYTLGYYTGAFWNLADVNYFVDSDMGSDTAAGTYSAPFKTLSKAQTVMSAGQVVMINGVFLENLSITKAIRIVGAGGVNGRAVFYNGATRIIINNPGIVQYIDNIITINYDISITFWNFYSPMLCSNCIFQNNKITPQNSSSISPYFSIFIGSYLIAAASGFLGNNNTLYNCTSAYVLNNYMYGSNNHINNALLYTGTGGYNNLRNIDGKYLDPKNLNFNFASDSPLYKQGTYNSISMSTNNVGAGQLGQGLSALDAELSSAATLTNLSTVAYVTDDYYVDNLNNDLYKFDGSSWVEKTAYSRGTTLPDSPSANDYFFKTNTGQLYQYVSSAWVEILGYYFRNVAPSTTTGFYIRTNEAIDGVLETGTIDFAQPRKNFAISLNQSLILTSGKITKAVQYSSATQTNRVGLYCELKFGNTTDELAACPYLLYEYGKIFTFSIVGGAMKGNADPSFDPASYTIATARYVKAKLTMKNLS